MLEQALPFQSLRRRAPAGNGAGRARAESGIVAVGMAAVSMSCGSTAPRSAVSVRGLCKGHNLPSMRRPPQLRQRRPCTAQRGAPLNRNGCATMRVRWFLRHRSLIPMNLERFACTRKRRWPRPATTRQGAREPKAWGRRGEVLKGGRS